MDVEPSMKLASYFAFVVSVVAAVIANQDLGLAEEVVPDMPVVAFAVPVVAFVVPVLALVVPVLALVAPATLDGPVDVFVVPAVPVAPVIPAGPVDLFAAPVVANDEHVAVQLVALVALAAEAVVVMPVFVVALDLVPFVALVAHHVVPVGVVVVAELLAVLVGVVVLVQFAVAFVQLLETSSDSEVALTVFVVAYFVLPEHFLAFLPLENLFVAADLALMNIFHPT